MPHPASLPTAPLRLSTCLLLLLLAGATAHAQQARVEVDHATGDARLIVTRGPVADTTALGDEPVVRLPRSVPVEVRVVNTNTALYRFTKSVENVALPEVATLQGFAPKFTPYVPELRAALSRRGAARGGAEPAAGADAAAAARLALVSALGSAERGLLGVDEAVYGDRGLQPTLTTLLLALEQMRRGVAPEAASEPLRRMLGTGSACGRQDPVQLPTARDLLTALSNVASVSGQLQLAVYGASFEGDAQWRALRDSALVLERRVQAVLSDFEPLVASAYHVERLVGIVANACSYWSAGDTRGTLTQGKQVTIRVEPRAEPELARLADRRADQFTVLVQPKAVVRPAFAIAAVAAPDARFPRYATREVAGGLEIYESGRTDRRFGLGGSLGFTWAMLDRRSVAVWLPEIVIAAGDLTGAGIGAGVSLGFVKLGAGALWMRHEMLEGSRPGDVIPDASGMRVVEGYGKPRLYVSLSVFEWAPFADRIPQQ